MTLRSDFVERRNTLVPLATAIEEQLREYLGDEPRIDGIRARAKDIDRFLAKASKVEGGELKYKEPLNQIQDQVGARVVTFYNSDVNRISAIIEKYYRPLESKELIPESESAFGYFGKHYVLLIPKQILDSDWNIDQIPNVFELQIKTMFQHAWSEASHDLGYKPNVRELTSSEKRKLAFTAAQAWGADQIFQELFTETTTRSSA